MRGTPLPEGEEGVLAEGALQTTHALKGWWDFQGGPQTGTLLSHRIALWMGQVAELVNTPGP